MCLVGSSTTVQKAKVESSIPRKRGAAAAGYDKALHSFFNKVLCQLQMTAHLMFLCYIDHRVSREELRLISLSFYVSVQCVK